MQCGMHGNQIWETPTVGGDETLVNAKGRTARVRSKRRGKRAESKLVKRGSVITHNDISGEFVLSDVGALYDQHALEAP